MKRRRMVSRKVRFDIWRRDGFRCWSCNASIFDDDVVLDIDHITPVVFGGLDDPGNLQTLCQPCHALKSGPERRTPVFDPPAGTTPERRVVKQPRPKLIRRTIRAQVHNSARRVLCCLAMRGPEVFTLSQAQQITGSTYVTHEGLAFLRDHGFLEIAWRRNARQVFWQLSEQAIRWLDWIAFDWKQRRAS